VRKRGLGAVATIAVLAVVAGGCADEPKAQAGAALDAFIGAYAAGDARGVCALLTPAARAATRVRLAGRVYGPPCEAAVSERLAVSGSGWRPALRTLTVTSVTVQGDRASGVSRFYSLNGGGPTPLQRIGGRWLVAITGDLRLTPATS